MAKTTILPNGDRLNLVFDATQEELIRFTYTGNQVVKNRLVIRDNNSGAIVYNQQVESMRLEHVLPANSLVNGTVYNARVTVTYRNANGTFAEDDPSDMVIINCYALPTVTLDNLVEGGSIGNSSFALQFTYKQTQSNLLNRYIVRLFNSSNQEIWNSGYVFPAPTTATYQFTETIRNLENNFHYYVLCEVEAVIGLRGQTPRIGFDVSYIRPRSYSTMYVENMPEEYGINVRSNIKVIDGSYTGTEPTYIDGTKVDLSNGETIIQYTDMGSITTDAQIMLEVSHKDEIGKDIMWLDKNSGEHIRLRMLSGVLYGETVEKMYAVLYQYHGNIGYLTYSNRKPMPSNGQIYCVSVTKIGAFYEVSIF